MRRFVIAKHVRPSIGSLITAGHCHEFAPSLLEVSSTFREPQRPQLSIEFGIFWTSQSATARNNAESCDDSCLLLLVFDVVNPQVLLKCDGEYDPKRELAIRMHVTHKAELPLLKSWLYEPPRHHE